MVSKFKVGDHVTWNSEAGHVSGKIIKVHTKDIDYKGHTHHASEDEPQYEIKSDKTDHIAMHKGSALKKLVDETTCSFAAGTPCRASVQVAEIQQTLISLASVRHSRNLMWETEYPTL